MSDLRRKAVKNGKTVSRKAQQRLDSATASAAPSPKLSPHSSRPGSRPQSRTVSRQVSEDEGGGDYSSEDDVMTASTTSISEDIGGAGWIDQLRDRIVELHERKRSSTEGRVVTLKIYNNILRGHYAGAEISASAGNIIPALMKSINSGSTEERLSAVTALTLTTLTFDSPRIHEVALKDLDAIVNDENTDPELKAEAIQAKAVVTLYSAGNDNQNEELLQYLLDIAQTNGASINSEDSAPVVAAALKAWGFVASHLDDFSDFSEEALDVFVDQLDSGGVATQGPAGNNIAFLYEASRDHEEETGETLVLPIDPKRLVIKLKELARTNKRTAKKDRKEIRNTFGSIATSLELGKGPGWSTSLRPEYRARNAVDDRVFGTEISNAIDDLYVYGYRNKLRANELVINIDSWSLKARVDTFKSIFKGGLSTHVLENPALEDIRDAGARAKADEYEDDEGYEMDEEDD